jgi:hypothetical protein
MGYSQIDKWLIGEGTDTGRWYVVHTQFPRFVIEMCDRDGGGYESGPVEMLDECLDVSLLARLAREAGELFAEYDKQGELDD